MNPKSKMVCFVCALVLGMASACCRAEEVKRMQPLLGTYIEITASGGSKARMNEAVEAGFKAIREVDRLLSSFRADSEIERLNRLAGTREMAVSPWTFECLFKAMEVGEQSGGAFDVTCRPLLDLWGFLRREYRLPTPTELRIARELVDFRQIELREWPGSRQGQPRRTAFLRRAGLRVDLGGIGKGFAVDKALEAVRAAGVDAGLVRAWGDARGFGPRHWSIEIEKGRRTRLREGAISTSGNYENFFELEGKRYAHIVDPRTGMPVQGVRSVTVKAARCVDADAWATALFVDPALRPAGIEIVFLDRE